MTSPSDATPAKSSSRGFRVLAVAAVVLIVLALLWSCFSGSASEPETVSPEVARVQAIRGCEDRVQEGLRSPGTAEFGDSQARQGAGSWTVTGHVDAQNGFGATVRSDFTCVARVAGEMVTTSVTELEQR